MKKKNHFVPKLYLKNFTSDGSHVFAYRTLVPSSQVPLWKECHISSLAYHEFLYVRLAAGEETDELESWLDAEVETPAANALQRAVNDERLSPEDWRRLIRFAVSLDVRTPANFRKSASRWQLELEALIQASVLRSIDRFENGEQPRAILPTDSAAFPSQVRILPGPGKELARIEAKILAGRTLWHWQIKHVLTSTVAKILDHRWTILKAPPGKTFFTSDNPVIKLNFWSDEKYNFGGGWANKGTDIFIPLSPCHLLYTQVGKKLPLRGDFVHPPVYSQICRYIAEHAERRIIATTPTEAIQHLRNRTIDKSSFQAERQFWKDWRKSQANAERNFQENTERVLP